MLLSRIIGSMAYSYLNASTGSTLAARPRRKALLGSRAPQLDRSIHGFQAQLRAALPDRAADLAARKLSVDHERKVRRDVSVYRAGMDRGIEGRRQFEIDAAVYRMEIERA